MNLKQQCYESLTGASQSDTKYEPEVWELTGWRESLTSPTSRARQRNSLHIIILMSPPGLIKTTWRTSCLSSSWVPSTPWLDRRCPWPAFTSLCFSSAVCCTASPTCCLYNHPPAPWPTSWLRYRVFPWLCRFSCQSHLMPDIKWMSSARWVRPGGVKERKQEGYLLIPLERQCNTVQRMRLYQCGFQTVFFWYNFKMWPCLKNYLKYNCWCNTCMFKMHMKIVAHFSPICWHFKLLWTDSLDVT